MATCLFSLINTLSIAAAAYSTLVFTLIVIYSKTAIGMELDGAFLGFFAATAGFRETAFISFFYSMAGFILSFSFHTFLKNKGLVRYIESIPVLIASIVGMTHFKSIMDLATTFVFSG